jgi:hypothetical protein
MASARGTPSSASKRRDFNQMERVRLRAARMFEQGLAKPRSPTGWAPHARTPTAGTAAGNKATAPPSAPPGGPAASPDWTAERAAGSSGPWARAPWPRGSAATCGPWSGSRS